MMHSNILIYIFVMGMLSIGISGAVTTVTLTGTCSSSTINSASPYLNFSLHNSGNGFASSIVAAPLFSGLSTYNSSLVLNALGPNSTYDFSFKLKNFTMPGSYVESIILSYQQGTSSFTTMYSCIMNVGQVTHSLLIVSGSTFNNSKLNVTVLSIANYTINGTVKAFVPPLFTVKPPFTNLTVRSFTTNTTSFNVTLPKYTNATIPIAIGVSYTRDGLHYAALSIENAVIFHGKAPLMSYTEIGAIAVIAIIVVLILVSVVRGKRPKKVGTVSAVQQSQQ